jgi:IS605 OrfB family transposase
LLTLKLKIKNLNETDETVIKQFQQSYSYAFRKLYVNYFDTNYKELSKKIEKEFQLNSWFIHSLQIEVETKIEQTKTNKKQLESKILFLHKAINLLNSKQSLNKKEKQNLYKLNKKLIETNKTLSKNLVFGGKANLKEISKLHNKVQNFTDQTSAETITQVLTKLIQTTDKYKNQRILSISSCGDALNHGNRFFAIQDNLSILFKPNKTTKIKIEYFASKSQLKTIERLKDVMKECSQPIGFRLSTEYIWITYDEQVLNGFAFDTKSWSHELTKHPKTNEPVNKELRTFITKQFHQEQKQRQLKNKIQNRYTAVDLNPQYIGYSICDYNGTEQTIIQTGCFDLTGLNSKLKLSSSDSKQLYQNNKRIYEINHVWKQLFKIASHFKCAYFVMEDLNFKSNVINDHSKEANRQTKNLWHRRRTEQLIKKYTNQLGIQLIEVNPCYTSFIGNINYNFYDPTNASLEINRRGALKFIKSQFYPEFNLETALNAMSSLNPMIQMRDVLMTEGLNDNSTEGKQTWSSFYNLAKQAKLKYRRSLEGIAFKESSLNNIKSKVFLYSFDFML